MKKHLRLLLVSALILSFGVSCVVYASSTYTINSNGILKYDGNGNGSYADNEDVIFDSNDLVNINNQVSVLKTGMEDYETQLQSIASDVEQLSNDIVSVSDSLGGLSFYEDEDGNKYVVGADALPKKLGKEPICIPQLYYNGTYGSDITNTIVCDGYETCTIGSISASGGTFYVALYSTASGTSQISKTAYSGSNKTIPLNGAKSIAFIFSWNDSVYNSMSIGNIVIN